MARITVGKFTYDPDAETIEGPAAYMEDQGSDKLKKILDGKDMVFNMCSHHSPNIQTAILVSLQTDYAGWRGIRELIERVK